MKNRPEKKEVYKYDHTDLCPCEECKNEGRNQTIDEYQAFLPTEEEIEDISYAYLASLCIDLCLNNKWSELKQEKLVKVNKLLATAIHNRLMGKEGA